MTDKSQDQIDVPKCAIAIARRNNQRCLGAAVLRRLPNNQTSEIPNPVCWGISLYEFYDNEQFSNVDGFLLSIGDCELYASEDIEDVGKTDNRKLQNLFKNKKLTSCYVKRSFFRKNEVATSLRKLMGKDTHFSNTAETEMSIAYPCIECLIQKLGLLEDVDNFGCFDLKFSSLDNFMKIDSAAAEAVNLLPKADHPSKYGSIYGVLNYCKTKMGQRLLERWLRQPLLDHEEINRRLDIVEILTNSTVSRNSILEGPLNGIPDLDLVVSKLQRKNAGLGEVFRLYQFTRSLPNLVNKLNELVQSVLTDDPESTSIKEIQTRFHEPLEILNKKFTVYQQFVEHVMDLSQLPHYVVDARHDTELHDLKEEMDQLQENASEIHRQAVDQWASFTDVKLDANPQYGYILRTTKGDDERQLRANNSNVQILSIQKNGVHFTTSKLKSIGERLKEVEAQYKIQQQELVRRALETASSYLPIVETASGIIAELDVLTSFATLAALSPSVYVRPKVLPRGSGVLSFQNARHPCVELMDDVKFIANNYDLRRGVSGFQIITGPNMGGKSTYIRGIGSIAIMAQVGSFVPCESATLSVLDCILARVGAGDAVHRGVSTFMAEMLEASVILKTATKDSLIIIDELGRGTSTFDGFGLAWAISEHIITKIDCLCLFATHFHELTALSHQYSMVTNKHVSAHVSNNQVVMLYNVEDGACKESFGIHVAKMANFPATVIEEAKRKAAELENVQESDDSSESKRQKTAEAMEKFSALPIETFSASEWKLCLKEIFPPYSNMLIV